MTEDQERPTALPREAVEARIDTLEEQLAANTEELAEIRRQLKADKLNPLVYGEDKDPKQHEPILLGRKPEDFVDSNPQPKDFVEPPPDPKPAS
ncbi:MAG: hypothetical protein QOF77_1830 [Solirubrobacteraceae bacterium]|nr:hypothetical protein [Solirubrobacteraceae bacterium]